MSNSMKFTTLQDQIHLPDCLEHSTAENEEKVFTFNSPYDD
jgi:hypothetical protein